MSTIRRLAILLACLLAGIGVGVFGSLVTGSDWWYMTISVAVAVGWLFVGTPEQCSISSPKRSRPRDAH